MRGKIGAFFFVRYLSRCPLNAVEPPARVGGWSVLSAGAMVALLLSALLVQASFAAVRGERAAYVGGTVSDLKQGTEGALDASGGEALRFDYKGGQFSLPYRQIVTLEFGQKVGRRVGAALGGMVALGLPGLLILMSKKKKHFLTIGYRDDAGTGQAVVFEIAKGTVASLIPSLEARTGKRVEDEAGNGFEVGHAAAPHVPSPPPAPKPPPPTSSLVIESDPAGAAVFVDAVSYGVAPVTATLPPGSKYVMLRLDGFEVWSGNVEAAAGATVPVKGQLKKIAETPNVIVVKPSGTGAR